MTPMCPVHPDRPCESYKRNGETRYRSSCPGCRKAPQRELDDLRALLYAYGEEERARLEHTCRCNGSHVLAYDEDGDPRCETCSKPRLDTPSKGDVDPDVLDVFDAESSRHEYVANKKVRG